jgi:hypothetical protein
MLYSRQRTLEDEIIDCVLPGPITVKALHGKLAARRGHVSLRGVYKAVDQLIEAGALLKSGKRVRIDEEWKRAVSAKLSPPAAAPLGEGERAAYIFTSIGHLDAFWKTIALQLEAYEKDGQIFFYNPHNFWAYVPDRRESEAAYYRHFDEARKHAYFTVGGETEGDREWKRAYQTEHLQIDTRPLGGVPRNSHLTIMGDFIISVRLPKAMALAIDDAYGSGKNMAEILPKIAEALKSPGNIRLVLEHNPRRAAKLRRALSLNFYFKKPTE